MKNGWTPERRARQAELIRLWKPWECSTGPISAAGKAVAAGNARKGGLRAMLAELRKLLKEQAKDLEKYR